VASKKPSKPKADSNPTARRAKPAASAKPAAPPEPDAAATPSTAIAPPAAPAPARPSSVPGGAAANQNFRWDSGAMKSTYANFAHVAASREEVVLLFGVSKAWEPEQRNITVNLSHRIILSPTVARRILDILNNAIT